MSLSINKNNSNVIVVTLFEKTTITNPTYLWEFKNVESGNKYYCICAELSTELLRYNEFIIIETGTVAPVPLSGQLKLPIGDYEYTVYQQASTTNLNPTGLTIVEVGDATCFDSTTNTNKEYTGGEKTNKVYNPNV